jgi:glycosyltransferase involved in cell wall biosynthesis
MRLLVVGHPFIVGYNQKKYVAMKQLDPELRLRIVGPKQIPHLFGTRRCEVHSELAAEEVIPLGSFFSRWHMSYVLDPVRMAGILREFRPDLIHVEEEPHAFITAETFALRDAFYPQAAITIFTWDNLHRRRPFPLSSLKHWLRAYSLRRTSAVVCGNREAQDLLRERAGYSGYTEVLPQFGLDPDNHSPGNNHELRQQLGLTGSIVVGCAGRLIPEKGIGLLVGALERLAHYPWKLLLVGSGPLEQKIHQEWMPKFPGRIAHVPAVPHPEVPRYLRCLDIFVLASYAVANWKEQFGLTLAQAMMLGTAPVASSSGAIPEVAGPGGLVFEEGNEESLRDALESLLSSASRRTTLAGRSREFALEHYTLDAVGRRYLEVFEQARRLHAAARRQPSAQAAVAESGQAYHR